MTLMHLIRCIQDGRLVLPSIQRNFAWSVGRIFHLLDSVMRGYPIGIVLLWETYQNLYYRSFSSDLSYSNRYPIRDNQENRKLWIVLDGQQRLQSLYITLFGSYKGKSLYIDILSGKETDEITGQNYGFKFFDAKEYLQWQSNESAARKCKLGAATHPRYFLRMGDLLSYCAKQKVALRRKLAEDLFLSECDQERLEMNLNCLDEVLNKKTNILKTLVIDEDLSSDSPHRKTEADILEIFVRINRSGTTLSRSDLIFSILKLNWRESAVTLAEFAEQINTGNCFHLDVNFVIRCLFAVSDVGTRIDADLLRNPSIVHKLQTNFPKCADAIRSAIDTVSADCRCPSSEMIGGAATLIPFVYYLYHTPHHEIPDGQRLNFRKALYLSGLAKTFSGHADKRLRKFIRGEMQPLAEKQDLRFPFAALVAWVRYWDGHASFGPELLQSNPRLALHLLQERDGAHSQYWRNFPEMDHIFPRSELLKIGYGAAEIGDFANFWILPKGRNMNKSNKPPRVYFGDVSKGEMASALIDPQLLDFPSFEMFLKSRGRQIVQVLRERLEFTDGDFRVPVLRFTPLPQSVPKRPPGRTRFQRLRAVLAERRKSRARSLSTARRIV